MRALFFCAIISLFTNLQSLYGQCEFITPPPVKRVTYAARQVMFSGITMNGQKTTYLEVEKGEKVKIKTIIQSKRIGDYCPSCIVQIYWGIKGHVSVCAKSFYGYEFSRKTSSLKFNAPMKDGIYYITMGGTLDYSCKNNKNRPSCSPEDAFAVLKVGNPSPKNNISLTKAKKGSNQYLQTKLIESKCYGNLDKISWTLNGAKLPYDDKKEVPLTQYGTYRVTWSNCTGSISEEFQYNSENENIASPIVKETPPTQNTHIAELVENNDTFVLENLIFDLGRSAIKPEAQQDLDDLSEIMKKNPSMEILLEGHTDYRGSAKKNQILSEKRVESAKEYLVKRGVPERNIKTKGWGHRKPLIVTKDLEKAAINRRVEVKILSR